MADWISNGESLFDIRNKLNLFHSDFLNVSGNTGTSGTSGIDGSGSTMTGQEIVSELNSLEFIDKLQSADITYNDVTVKDVLDSLLDLTGQGDILIKAIDSNNQVNLKFDILSGGTLITSDYTTTTDKIFSLPFGTYSIVIYPIGYDLINISIKDNNTLDNYSLSTSIDFVDIGIIRSDIVVYLKPSILPIINSFTINNGETTSSSQYLNISLDTDGIINEYMISQSSNFNAGVWVEYTGDFVYQYNYISEILLTLYIKVRNSVGVSTVKTSSITMINGITRSDSSKTYNDIDTCINEIIEDYGTGLTQDVLINVTNDVYQVGKGRGAGYVFFMTIENFNLNTDHILTIKGNNRLYIDCRSVGGFKLNFCSNFIFDGINFLNVANNAYDYAPEQTCAIFAQGTPEQICKNIVVNNCNINGHTLINTTNYYGYYGLIFKYFENVSVLNTIIQGISAFAMDIRNLGSLSLSNVNINNCHVNYGVVSQPCFVNIKFTELFYIEDSTFDMTDFETGIISNNLIRLICKRSSFINAKGEAFRLQNTVDMELFELNSCVLSGNLTQPHYSWIKQHIAIDIIKEMKLLNNTIRLTEIGGYSLYAKLFAGGEIKKYYSYNNIFDFYFPNLPNNKDQATLVNINKLGYMESDYNVYRDYTLNNDSIINLFFNIINSTSTVYLYRTQSLTSLRSKNYDINSIVMNTSDTLFTNNTLTGLTTFVTNFDVNTGYTSDFDRNKHITDSYNVGAYHQTFTLPTVDNVYKYIGIDTYKLEDFTSDEPFNTFSKNLLLIIPISNEKGIYFKWIIEDETSNKIIYFGISNSIRLYSKLNINEIYTGDMDYDIEILKITT
jgi:hypothetical protein